MRRYGWREELRVAAEVPRWAWRCYRRHLPVIAGLSLVASVQRVVVVGFGEHVPALAAGLSEALVVVVRLALLALITRWALRGVPTSWANVNRFVTAHWPSLVIQTAFLGAVYLVFGVVAEELVLKLLPASARDAYLSALLFVKNPTIIAFTFVWVVGIVRQLLCDREQSPVDVRR
ncbi:hypothetical protein B0I33_102450 [Prauserella shujinwangii]|uniref:Uncharacterized protein n=1 Tax=Prauserella shujinwangii TaxID=1453103 RepID=A0A2T0M154_9PSEU|nr:hypothetical protein [Prauserella shujinwangii]PRX50329.1 hypothetical protein B0I33_102450 [Prauserella shujinwangii]